MNFSSHINLTLFHLYLNHSVYFTFFWFLSTGNPKYKVYLLTHVDMISVNNSDCNDFGTKMKPPSVKVQESDTESNNFIMVCCFFFFHYDEQKQHLSIIEHINDTPFPSHMLKNSFNSNSACWDVMLIFCSCLFRILFSEVNFESTTVTTM